MDRSPLCLVSEILKTFAPLLVKCAARKLFGRFPAFCPGCCCLAPIFPPPPFLCIQRKSLCDRVAHLLKFYAPGDFKGALGFCILWGGMMRMRQPLPSRKEIFLA